MVRDDPNSNFAAFMPKLRPGVSIPVLDTNGLCLNITQTISKYEWASVFCVRTNHPEGYELGRGRRA